jgi:hypothetical protein
MCQLIWLDKYNNKDVLNAQGQPNNVMCLCQKETRWDIVRYFIEDKYKMVARHKSEQRHASSCIVGIRAADVNKPFADVYALGDDCNVHMMGLVVLVRFPVGAARFNAFIPATIRAKQEREKLEMAETERRRDIQYKLQSQTLSEEDKIALLQELATTVEAPVARYVQREHPSRAILKNQFLGYWNYQDRAISWSAEQQAKPPPPSTWKCYRCYNYFHPVHYIDACPSHEMDHWIPMNKRSMPTGLPKTRLQSVDMDDVNAVATAPYLDPYGNLWTMI